MDELIILFILLSLAYFWWSSSIAYELAYQVAKKSCQEKELILLDDTLQMKKIRLCRHYKGHAQFCRVYEFEFSSDGEVRYKGHIKLNGKSLDSVNLEAYRIV